MPCKSLSMTIAHPILKLPSCYSNRIQTKQITFPAFQVHLKSIVHSQHVISTKLSKKAVNNEITCCSPSITRAVFLRQSSYTTLPSMVHQKPEHRFVSHSGPTRSLFIHTYTHYQTHKMYNHDPSPTALVTN